tara:strand:- start:423 stop:1622 length:1200 start_codon:yes stop_codon:yes gene_type:complete
MALKTLGSFAESTQGAYKIKTTPAYSAAALGTTRSDALVTQTETTDLAGKSITVSVGVTGAGDKGTAAVAATNTCTFHDVPYTAATATFTFADDQNSPSGQQTITLIDTAGTSRTYTIDNDYGASGALEFNSGATGNTAAANFKIAVEGSSGHNGTITVGVAGDVVTLTQAVKGPDGNTSIAHSGGWDGLTDVNVGAAFAGGAITAVSSASIELEDGSGDKVTYTPVAGTANAYVNEFSLGTTKELAAANFVALVNNSSKGHGDSSGITAVHAGSGVVNLTQKVLGVAGNTTCTMAGNMGAYMSVDLNTKFAGGVDRMPVKCVLQTSNDGVSWSSEADSVEIISDVDTGSTLTSVGTIASTAMPSAPYYRIGLNVDEAANIAGASNTLITTIAFSHSTI